MEASLAHLIRAQLVDKRLEVLVRRLASLPVELGERDSSLNALEAEAEELEAERRACITRSNKLETEVGGRDDRIAKLEKQAVEARDPSAVQVAQHEAAKLRDENSEAQEEALELLEKAEQLAERRAGMEEGLVTAREDLEALRKNVAVDQTDLENEVATLRAEREAEVQEVNTTIRDAFQVLAEKHPGKAVVPLKGDSCGGCGTRLTPNDRVRVQAAKGLIRCPSCTRILVTQELWGKVSEPVQ
ncbi:MAG: zinc ribbon domain-containing protein [Planctomycetota bacterium]